MKIDGYSASLYGTYEELFIVTPQMMPPAWLAEHNQHDAETAWCKGGSTEEEEETKENCRG